MRGTQARAEDSFAVVMADRESIPDMEFDVATVGLPITTKSGAVVTPTNEDVGRFVDKGTGAIVSQSIVDWFVDAWRVYAEAHPDWAPEQIEAQLRAPVRCDPPIPINIKVDFDPHPASVTSMYQTGPDVAPSSVTVTRYNGTTTVIAPEPPAAHKSIQIKINTQKRLLSALAHLEEDLKTAGVRLDHWAITEIKTIAHRA